MIPSIEEILSRRPAPNVSDPREEALNRLKRRIKRQENQSIALVGALATMASELPALDPEMQPEVLEALRQQYPNAYGPLSDGQIVERVGNMSPDELSGLLNVKGKLLESEVVNRLNEGADLGGLELSPGQHAELASSATQPGYDIIIHNADGSVATELSAKCSNDVGEVVRALERYPEYQIIGSSELAAQHPDVIDAGMSDADIAETVGESFEAAGEVGEALDIVGDILPGLPIIFVAGRHGVRLVMGKTTFEKAVRTAAPQLIEAGVFTGIGFGLAALDMGLFSIPVMIFGKFLWGWIKDRRRAKQYLLDAYSNLETIMSQRPRFAEE